MYYVEFNFIKKKNIVKKKQLLLIVGFVLHLRMNNAPSYTIETFLYESRPVSISFY